MKLYEWHLSPSPRRVRMFLAEKGLEIPMVQVELPQRAQFEPAFEAINPWCTVPALELDDGTVISEAIAICRYLEAAYPDPPLMGVDAKDAGLVAMWEHRFEWDGFLAVAETIRNTLDRMRGRALTGPHDFDQIPALAERGRQRVKLFFETIDARAAKSEFMAGTRYTVADITALVSVDFAERAADIPLPEDLRHANRWHEQMSARPSASA